MCNGWKKGMKALSLRRQMGAGSFNRCRCSSCCILYQKAKAGIDNNLNSTSGKKKRKTLRFYLCTNNNRTVTTKLSNVYSNLEIVVSVVRFDSNVELIF